MLDATLAIAMVLLLFARPLKLSEPEKNILFVGSFPPATRVIRLLVKVEKIANATSQWGCYAIYL